MNRLSPERWTVLWQFAGAVGDSLPWFQRLSAAYAEPQRHYHNQRHIAECLHQLDSVRHLARDPLSLELALWFHDAVYNPQSSRNEEDSAELARSCFAEAKLAPASADHIQQLIMVTKTHELRPGTDLELMVDIDLAILGSSCDRFAEYDQAIRLEYGWVPDPVFRQKRVEVLERFLARERIYGTDWFFLKYEYQARTNLEKSIDNLKRAEP